MQGYGERLRTARQRRALELADVAKRLKIPAKELRALEWERPDLLPSTARAEAVRSAYEQFLRAGDNGTRPAAVRPAPGWRRFVLVLVLAVAGGLGAATGLSALLLADGDETPTAEPEPAAERVVPPVPSPSPVPASPAPPTPPAAPARVNAVLTASRGDSWVEARRGSATGAALYEGLLRQGDSVRVSSPRVWLRLGAASNIDVRVNGKPAPKLVGTVEVVLVPRSAPPA